MKAKIKVRQARMNDVPDLLKIDKEIWPKFRADEEMFRSRLEVFPQGQLVAVVKERVISLHGCLYAVLFPKDEHASLVFYFFCNHIPIS